MFLKTLALFDSLFFSSLNAVKNEIYMFKEEKKRKRGILQLAQPFVNYLTSVRGGSAEIPVLHLRKAIQVCLEQRLKWKLLFSITNSLSFSDNACVSTRDLAWLTHPGCTLREKPNYEAKFDKASSNSKISSVVLSPLDILISPSEAFDLCQRSRCKY